MKYPSRLLYFDKNFDLHKATKFRQRVCIPVFNTGVEKVKKNVVL